MILATTQEITAITAVNGAAGTPDDLIDYTFDTTYSSDTVGATFALNCVCSDTVYIGIAGHNIGSLGGTITINNHGTDDILSYVPIDNRPLMFEIPARSGSDITITVTKASNGNQIIISHIASGQTTDFTSVTNNGQIMTKDYDAGYALAPMNRGRKSRAILNQSAAPTATLIKTISQKVKLTVKNLARDFVAVELLDYQLFWTENSFFIQNDNDPQQSFMGMQFIPATPKASGSTRSLLDVSYSLVAYNGL
tara:strand:- start:498 stop:1253 length:756 start_codon:yes stop_codon:yes gene_type:complete